MNKSLKYADSKGIDYAELRTTTAINSSIKLNNRKVEEIGSSEEKLYSVRILHNGAFGMANSTNPEFNNLIDMALKSAKSVKKELRLHKIPDIKKRINTPFKKSLLDIDISKKKSVLQNLEKLRKNYPKVKSLVLRQADSVMDYSLINSHGADLKWKDSRIIFAAFAFSQNGTRQENYFDLKRGHYGYELMNEAPKITKLALDFSQKLLKAKSAKGGNFPVVLDQDLGGVFTHEAIGHATEADAVLNGETVLKDKLNKIIASSNVTIIDDGTQNSNGWIPFDDDGTKTKSNVLINKGELKKYLQSLETASIMNVNPTGNGRSEDISCNIIPRMTNTFLDRGDSNLNEMIKSIKEGYYIVGSNGGQVDPSRGEFLFNGKHGFVIKNGEIKDLVKGVSLTGNILDIMPKINLIAKDLQLRAGMCGKCSQTVPVSVGSPHFKIDMARVGGQK